MSETVKEDPKETEKEVNSNENAASTGEYNLSSAPTQDIIDPELILPKKKEIFKDLLAAEEDRTTRHYASRKLIDEKWIVIEQYLKESLSNLSAVGNYLYVMVEFHKREVDAHVNAEKTLLPSRYPVPGKAEPAKEREDSFLNVITTLHDFHKGACEKSQAFIDHIKNMVATKIQPIVDDFRFLLRDITATYDDLAFKFEEAGKITYLTFDKLDATLAQTIKSVTKNGKSKDDFWLVYAAYIRAVHVEDDTRRELLQYLGTMFERIKKLETTRVEVCTSSLEDYINSSRTLYDETVPLLTPPIASLTQTDAAADIKKLIADLKGIKETALNEKQKAVLAKEESYPKFATNPMAIKYGKVSRFTLTQNWEESHTIITQDRHFIVFNGAADVFVEDYFCQYGCDPVSDLDLTCSTIIRMKSLGDFALQIVEKAKKMGFLPTVSRCYYKFPNDEMYQEWLQLFRTLKIPIEIELLPEEVAANQNQSTTKPEEVPAISQPPEDDSPAPVDV